MKLTVHLFSNNVKNKSKVLIQSLIQMGVEILPFSDLQKADGAIIYNIHGSVTEAIQKIRKQNLKILSLQEGLYGIGWESTIPAMTQECIAANKYNIMQFVWSNLDRDNYIKTGKSHNLIEYYGNPEHDLLSRDLKVTRESLGIPLNDTLIVHIDQYSHPRGGPDHAQMEQMRLDIQKLSDIKNTWVIRCPHPKMSNHNDSYRKDRFIHVPFVYPIFDYLRIADLIINLSSTEGITAAILNKPIIEYDISSSPSRWPFIEHGVAIRATNEKKLNKLVEMFAEGNLKLPKYINYREVYSADGNSSNRVATNIIKYFKK